MKPVIEISAVSKSYRLGQIGATTLRDDLYRIWNSMQGKQGKDEASLNKLSGTAEAGDIVCALDNVSFSVSPGERVGIIGKNGAGKSTLLKILSRITSPSTGKITVRGRMASLLEVGTGFHPEFTGRENIYLNGALLGMTHKEIDAKFDKIVDFSGVGRYVNTPVKRYSSGMRVRLGFAVAAHLDPDILVVDEVLAVGDAEFQSKALGKMNEVASEHGRSILFVSHNMNAIKNLCNRVIVMKEGKVDFDGPSVDGVLHYLGTQEKSGIQLATFDRIIESPEMEITNVQLLNEDGSEAKIITPGENYAFRTSVAIHKYNPGCQIFLTIRRHDESKVGMLCDHGSIIQAVSPDTKHVVFDMKWKNVLSPGNYKITGWIRTKNKRIDHIKGMHFEVKAVVRESNMQLYDGDTQFFNSVKLICVDN